MVETDGCFADGVSVASGCWFGRRTMRLVDHGKVAVTVTDMFSGESVRIWPNPLARRRAVTYASGASTRWKAQLIGYQVMPPEELMCSAHVALAVSLESVVGQPGVRVTCKTCGEEVVNGRQVGPRDAPLCRGCAGERYYTATTTAAPTGQFAGRF